MFRHTLMLLVATSSLADNEFFTGRRQNFNSNTNVNEVFSGHGKRLRPEVGVGRSRTGLHGGSPKYDIVLGPDTTKDRGGLYGGSPKYDIVLGPDVPNAKDLNGLYGGLPKYDIVLGPDMMKGKEHAGLYGGPPKYEIILGPEMASGQDHGGLYGGPQKFEIVLGPEIVNGRDRGGLLKFVKGGTGSGGFMSDYRPGDEKVDGGGYVRGSCDALADILLREDDDELAVNEEPTDVDGSREGQFEDNSNYNVVFKGGNRRHMIQQPYVINADPWESNDPNSNAVGSMHPRTYNWGTLRPTYLNVADGDRGNLDYDRNKQLYDRTEQDYERPSQIYERDYRGTNMNSNTNYNIFGGRRGNDNSNTNDVLITYDGAGENHGNIQYPRDHGSKYDQDEENRRYIQEDGKKQYSGIPLYSGYDKAGSGYVRQGSFGGFGTEYSTVGYTSKPTYAVLHENDIADNNNEDAIPYQNVNTNVNSNVNSNVNVMSRRQNIESKRNTNLFPRKKRSVKKFSTISERLDHGQNGGASTVSTLDFSTVAKPIAEILEKPRSSIHRDLM